MNPSPILQLAERQPFVFIHLLGALLALGIGAYLLARRPRGDGRHRLWGWAWALAMGTAALSSAFIRDFRMPNVAGFTPIHLFTLFVLIQLPLAVWAARTHRIELHRKTMRGLFAGGCVLAGVFTLLPGRMLGQLLWHQWLGMV
jgi:uncharacterized membrane protein